MTKESNPGDGRDGLRPDEHGYVRCEICGTPILDRHCKMVCPNCGAMRDCSDP